MEKYANLLCYQDLRSLSTDSLITACEIYYESIPLQRQRADFFAITGGAIYVRWFCVLGMCAQYSTVQYVENRLKWYEAGCRDQQRLNETGYVSEFDHTSFSNKFLQNFRPQSMESPTLGDYENLLRIYAVVCSSTNSHVFFKKTNSILRFHYHLLTPEGCISDQFIVVVSNMWNILDVFQFVLRGMWEITILQKLGTNFHVTFLSRRNETWTKRKTLTYKCYTLTCLSRPHLGVCDVYRWDVCFCIW